MRIKKRKSKLKSKSKAESLAEALKAKAPSAVHLTVYSSFYPSQNLNLGVGLVVNDQGAKRLMLSGNFESCAQPSNRSQRMHACRIFRSSESIGACARTVQLTYGMSLYNKLMDKSPKPAKGRPKS